MLWEWLKKRQKDKKRKKKKKKKKEKNLSSNLYYPRMSSPTINRL